MNDIDYSINEKDLNFNLDENENLISGKFADEEIKNSSTLILEEIEGNLFNEKKIEINAGGMIGGRRKADV